MTFSVLMATYHKEKPEFLRACLQSLADQTLPTEEIVLVKDGELTPELDAVIAEFSKLPIKPILHKGSGRLGGALAYGIQHCSHDIVARMDSDDIAVIDRFAIQYAALMEQGYIILGGQVGEFDNEPGDLDVVTQMPLVIERKNIEHRNPFYHPTVMFLKQAVLDAGNYQPMEGFEDWYLWLRMAKANSKFANLEKILVHVRTGRNFIQRRSGFRYASREVQALHRFYSENLMSLNRFLLAIASRIPLRILPDKILTIVYANVLRRRS